ncbi:MAG: hypothetical protein EBV82_03095 [Chitinophagia bacterium]|jgi:hypothetical protein|nr:hypothetical protein [Chitinophagia bacterium]
MKLNKQILVALVIMIVTSALYRVLPGRPYGFAPQIAIALFGGSLFANKKQYAFLLPIISMFISDVLYQVLYQYHLTSMQGFYEGQLLNYFLIAATAVFGFGLQSNKLSKYFVGFLAAPTAYFLVSNFLVWSSGGGYHHAFNLTGLIQTMVDGLPFYPYSVAGTLVFGGVLFGSFRLIVPHFKSI